MRSEINRIFIKKTMGEFYIASKELPQPSYLENLTLVPLLPFRKRFHYLEEEKRKRSLAPYAIRRKSDVLCEKHRKERT